ncbi:MAG: hypothetical protein UU48_C0006G0130 [Candidatus Uhrbacteria bacterium GW2011_GWF2_41_16]|uniref:Uncharacterized protein n=2 Tax=Candidatus Uhriibacteriota TaxID=1752732 RepID=A0A0G0XMV0_9BACT|nr:MAG: hypothetical protein UU35_C0007G0002 [Candidatus Uhrbacteria bacterium GW2011_GWC2_41_11]KKR98090.1 MAG: hypothetical protein UU48_C0006G0130 [Candidatus Uhrbacteria bacterium GW2011_GWF2_41_16]
MLHEKQMLFWVLMVFGCFSSFTIGCGDPKETNEKSQQILQKQPADSFLTKDLRIPVSMTGYKNAFDMQVLEIPNPYACSDAKGWSIEFHGFTNAPLIFLKYAEARLAMPESCRLKGILLVAHPGHGESGVPSDAVYGQIGLSEFIDAEIDLLETLSDPASPFFHPLDTMVVHSMAGQMLPVMEYELELSRASFHTYGIERILEIAPVPLSETSWAYAEGLYGYVLTSTAMRELTPYLRNTEDGIEIILRDAISQTMFYSLPNGGLMTTSPSLEEIGTWNFPESFTAAADMVGLNLSFQRPFAPSETLYTYKTFTIAAADDPFMTPEEICEVHKWNTGKICDETGGYFLIQGDGKEIPFGETGHSFFSQGGIANASSVLNVWALLQTE